MIRLEGFRCTYRGSANPALVDVNIELNEGEVLAVVGPRGSGKTTLALAAAGLLPLLYECETNGWAGWLSEKSNSAGPGVLTGETGFLPERPAATLSGLADTVFAEAAMALRNRAGSEDDIVRAVDRALASVGISHLASRHPFRLSGGEQKLVGLASALAQGSSTIVLDCPFAGLDRDHGLQLASALERYSASGGAILVTEHRMAHVVRMSCEVRLLQGGRLGPGVRTEKGIPRAQIDRWRKAGLPSASLHLADRGDVDPIPVRFTS